MRSGRCGKMNFIPTAIKGVFIIELDRKTDHRGYFARTYCIDEFKKAGIDFHVVQCNTSFNKIRGTVRGMHYQSHPYEEAKLVSCGKGSIYDAVLDIREGSETHGKWIGEILSDENSRMIYLPKGCAHGYQALADNTIVNYLVNIPYSQTHGLGTSYKQIRWPLPITAISEGDDSA